MSGHHKWSDVRHADAGGWGPCAKPDCMRKVSLSSRYCCGGCTRADESGYECGSLAVGDHPLISHSEGCDQRAAERGEWTVLTKPGER